MDLGVYDKDDERENAKNLKRSNGFDEFGLSRCFPRAKRRFKLGKCEYDQPGVSELVHEL